VLGTILLAGGVAAARPIEVTAAGDLQPGGTLSDPLAGLDGVLAGDLRLVNLEAPLTTRGAESGLDPKGVPQPGATVRFRVPPERARWLEGHVDVVSLANNHALDQGEAGRDDTVRALAGVKIAAAWKGHDAELTRAGRRVIVIAREFAPSAELDAETEVVGAVRAAKARGAVLVSLHWGHTGSLLPTPAQRRLAARLVDAGASAVLGHGPHTLQGLERRGRAVIAYSLGNLAFGCRCTDVTDAYAVRFALADDGAVSNVRALPIRAGIQEPPTPSTDPGLRDLIDTLSRDLN
jgi:poly-gamma-glutamate synthesis protein (capsule biosynthesis protein)